MRIKQDRKVVRAYQIFINGVYDRDFTGSRDELWGLVHQILHVENIKKNLVAFCRYEDGRVVEMTLTFGYPE